MHPTAKSLVLDLLSTLRQGAVPVRDLVRAAGLFGIAENSLRVALARLRASGLVEAPAPGRYCLGSGAAAVQSQVSSWRRLEQRVRPWKGGWIGVHTAALARGDRPALRRCARALRFLGFRELHPGLELRPDNLRLPGPDPVAAARARLHALGLEPPAPVFGVSDLDPETEARACALWDTRALRAGYRAATAELEASEARLRALPRERALVESFLVGGKGIRQLVFDPLLPEPVLPLAERRALVEALRRYDRIGRACWAGVLDVGTGARGDTPADLRGFEGAAAALAAAGGQ